MEQVCDVRWGLVVEGFVSKKDLELDPLWDQELVVVLKDGVINVLDYKNTTFTNDCVV